MFYLKCLDRRCAVGAVQETEDSLGVESCEVVLLFGRAEPSLAVRSFSRRNTEVGKGGTGKEW